MILRGSIPESLVTLTDQEKYIRSTGVILLGTVVLPASLPGLAHASTATNVYRAAFTSGRNTFAV